LFVRTIRIVVIVDTEFSAVSSGAALFSFLESITIATASAQSQDGSAASLTPRASPGLGHIALADRPHTSIHCLLARYGGIVPAVRRRSVLALTVVEREDISRGLASGSSIRDIAKGLERAVSTVSREVARHGGRPEYRANEADQRAWDSALRPKRCLLAIHVKLRKMVASKLILDWSPEQVSGWLKIQYPDDESMRLSHETIYRSLFIQARGVLKKELIGHLRSKRRIRRSRHSRIFKDSRGQITDAVSIRERPAEIEDRAIPGHWEGDLIGGTKNSHIATLVERHSRFTALVKVRSKDTAAVVAALSCQIRILCGYLCVRIIPIQNVPKTWFTPS
jgi:IS30 family transposase